MKQGIEKSKHHPAPIPVRILLSGAILALIVFGIGAGYTEYLRAQLRAAVRACEAAASEVDA